MHDASPGTGYNHALLCLVMLLHRYAGLLLGLPTLLHGPGAALLGALTYSITQSIVLAATFAVSHNVPESKPLDAGQTQVTVGHAGCPFVCLLSIRGASGSLGCWLDVGGKGEVVLPLNVLPLCWHFLVNVSPSQAQVAPAVPFVAQPQGSVTAGLDATPWVEVSAQLVSRTDIRICTCARLRRRTT